MKSSEKHFFVTGYMGQGAKRMLADLEEQENVTLIPEEIDNKGVRFLYYRFMNRIGFRKETGIKKIFQHFFCLSRIKYDSQLDNYVIFMNSKFWTGYDINFVKMLKKKYPYLKLILYIVDPMKNSFEKVSSPELFQYFNLILSINQSDCEKYGFQHYPLIYSFKQDINQGNESNTDIYYLGSGSDRTEKLYTIAKLCQKEDAAYSFNVLQNSQEEKKYVKELCYLEKPMSYEKNTEYIQNSNCILELMHSTFDNPTQRYVEAVVYNKKLLSDNSAIKYFPFYNPAYMQVFKEVKEIDWEWVKRKEEVDYEYNGLFSPLKLMKFIEKYFE